MYKVTLHDGERVIPKGMLSKHDLIKMINNPDPLKRLYIITGKPPKPDISIGAKVMAIIIGIILGTIAFMWILSLGGCTKPEVVNPATTTQASQPSQINIKVVLSIKYHQSDSVQWENYNPLLRGKIVGNTQTINFTETSEHGAPQQSLFECNEYGAENNSDSLTMQLYTNGSLTYSQTAIGRVSYMLNF